MHRRSLRKGRKATLKVALLRGLQLCRLQSQGEVAFTAFEEDGERKVFCFKRDSPRCTDHEVRDIKNRWTWLNFSTLPVAYLLYGWSEREVCLEGFVADLEWHRFYLEMHVPRRLVSVPSGVRSCLDVSMVVAECTGQTVDTAGPAKAVETGCRWI